MKKENDDQDTGTPKRINFNIDEITFDSLRKKRAFHSGVNMRLSEEYKSVDFSELPDVLPIQPKESFFKLDYKKLI